MDPKSGGETDSKASLELQKETQAETALSGTLSTAKPTTESIENTESQMGKREPTVATATTLDTNNKHGGGNTSAGIPEKVSLKAGTLSEQHGVSPKVVDDEPGNDQVTVDRPHEPLVAEKTGELSTVLPSTNQQEDAASLKNQAPNTTTTGGSQTGTTDTKPVAAAAAAPAGKPAGKPAVTTATVVPTTTTKTTTTTLPEAAPAVAAATATTVVNDRVVPSTTTTAPAAAVSTSAGVTRPTNMETRHVVLESRPRGDSSLTQMSAEDDKLVEARTPLTDLYGPFLAGTDTCLADARARLHKALEQAHTLRAAFTNRVYAKYRVCLVPPTPPAQVLERIHKDPVGQAKKLKEDRASIKEEKEIEKKEASKLNAELEKSSQSVGVDHAEQLMYLSAGLNLVILPEEVVKNPAHVAGYADRGPVNPLTGQKVKSISQAAATAGEVMLDRTRKAAAMRVERQRRRQLLLMSGETSSAAADSSYSRLQVLSSTTTSSNNANTVTAASARARPTDGGGPSGLFPSTAASKASRPPPSQASSLQPPPVPAAGKSSRSRQAVALSTSALLSLSPHADEIRTDGAKPSAATAALVARGVGVTALSSSKTTQQRLRHPHPESMGGRRRANMNPVRKDPKSAPAPAEQPFLQAYLALTLPPLPATKERLERKPLPVCPPETAATERAKTAVKTVLDHFRVAPKKERAPKDEEREMQSVTKIRLLNGLRKKSIDESHSPTAAAAATTTAPTADAPAVPVDESSSPVDPMLAFSVLHAIGLLGQNVVEQKSLGELLPSAGDTESSSVMWSNKLKNLRRDIVGKTPNTTDLFQQQVNSRKRAAENSPSTSAKRARVEQVAPVAAATAAATTVPVESIRGGGEVLLDPDGTSESEQRVESSKPPTAETKKAAPAPAPLPAPSVDSNGSLRQRSSHSSPSRANNNASSNNNNASSFARLTDHLRQQSQMHPELAPFAFVNPGPGPSVAARMPDYQTPQDRYPHASTLSTLHIAHQLRQMHHPTAGDLSDYLGQQQQHPAYDMSALMPAGPSAMSAAQSSLAALGLARHGSGLVGYNIHDRAVAARAMIVREQHAALLNSAAASHGYPPSAFPRVGTHPAAVSALLNSQTPGGMMRAGQMTMAQANAHGPMPSPARTMGTVGGRAHKAIAPIEPKPAPSNDEKQTKESAVSSKPSKSKSTSSRARASSGSSSSSQPGATAPALEEESKKSTGSALPNMAKAPPSSKAPLESRAEAKKGPPESAKMKPPTPATTQPAAAASNDAEQGGMRFFVPKQPEGLPEAAAVLIRTGRFADAAASLDSSKYPAALEYLLAVGAAVPIPRALVLSPLRDRLNTPGFKTSGSNGAPPIQRDIVVAVILVWLWITQEENFQQAFEKSGRIDVDPDCKWLIQAAVDTSVRELSHEIADSMAVGEGAFAEAAARKGNVNVKAGTTPANEAERSSISKKLEFHTASIVSKALMTEITVDRTIDAAIPNFQHLLEFLDESRLGALRAKSQERVLLANLIARKATMSEPFSQAYVSAMVRAGDAMGHGKLFETVQNELVLASTMIPYDIFTDDNDAWEDPCKTEECFTPGLNGDELVKRAHARAMIQKSLRKLQERQTIRGGTPIFGPFVEPAEADASVASSVASDARSVNNSAAGRPGFKRRISSISEPPAPPGTGSAEAKTWSVYEPKHVSEPLTWDPTHLENTPYGRHRRGLERPRSLSVSVVNRSGDPRPTKKTKRSQSVSVNAPVFGASEKDDSEDKVLRSTYEIDWSDVAGIFQRVDLPKKSLKTAPTEPTPPKDGKRVIYAPFCRKVDGDAPSPSSESDAEEDMSEDAVLATHEEVLDRMRAKLSAFLESRKQQQERRKHKSSK